MNEQYQLVRLLSRKNKEGKDYTLAYVVVNTPKNCSLLNILIKDEQKDKLQSLINSKQTDITKNVSIEYNGYQNAYRPVINL